METMAIGQMIVGGAQRAYYAFNTGAPPAYRFRVVGDTIEEQLATLQELSTAMMVEAQSIAGSMERFIELGNLTSEEAFDSLYSTTGRLLFNTEEIFTVEGTVYTFLDECLEIVGEALIAAL
ncbi:hypothetical protein [Phyllobacterium sp. K27]